MNRACLSCPLGSLLWAAPVTAASGSVEHDAAARTVTMADARRDLSIRLKYDGRCYLDRVQVRGREVVAPETGVCSAILVGGQWTTTRTGLVTPTVHVKGREVEVNGIAYTGGGIAVREPPLQVCASIHQNSGARE